MNSNCPSDPFSRCSPSPNGTAGCADRRTQVRTRKRVRTFSSCAAHATNAARRDEPSLIELDDSARDAHAHRQVTSNSECRCRFGVDQRACQSMTGVHWMLSNFGRAGGRQYVRGACTNRVSLTAFSKPVPRRSAVRILRSVHSSTVETSSDVRTNRRALDRISIAHLFAEAPILVQTIARGPVGSAARKGGNGRRQD